MRMPLMVLAVLLLPAVAAGQDFPRVTEEGKQAALELLQACVKAGALKVVKDPRTQQSLVVGANEKKLKEVVKRRRDLCTPAARNFLLPRNQHPGVVQLLLSMGQETGDRQATAFALIFAARLLEAQLKYREARQAGKAALKLFEQLKMAQWQGNSLTDLALICRAQGDLPQARTFSEQALALYKQLHGDRHSDVATSLNNLAEVCREQGDLTQARTLCEEALALRRQLHGERHPDVAGSLNNLALVCHAQGDLPQARKLHEQALDLFKQLPGERHAAIATSLNNLAAVCRAQGDLPQTRKLCQQALDLRKQFLGDRHPAVANSLNNLATVCREQGKLTQGRKLHEQTLALFKQLHGDRHPDVANSLSNLALVCYDQGDLPQASRYMTEAVLACRLLEIDRDRLTTLRAENLTCAEATVRQLETLGWMLAFSDKSAAPDRLRQAVHAYTLAADLLDRLRSGVLQEEGKLDQGARKANLVPDRVGLATALFKHSGEAVDLQVAFTAIEQGRGRVFLEALARARAPQVGNVPANLRAEEANLLAYIRGLDLSINKENAKTIDKRNADLVKSLYEQRLKKETALQKLAERLRKEYPRYAALMYPQPCILKEARACLGNNEVAVLFALDRKKSYAVLVEKEPAKDDPGQGVAVFQLPGSDEFDDLAGTLADPDVLRSDRDARQLGARLHSLLLKPLADRIKGKDLVIVPDGVLWQLPFELLVEKGKDGQSRYLIENCQIRYAQSMTTLHVVGLWEKTRARPDRPLWALGDPVYSADDPRLKGKPTAELLASASRATESYLFRLDRGETGKAPPRLTASGAEVRKVADLLGAPGAIVTDLEACERLVKEVSDKGHLRRCRYVHFATHGILGSAIGRPPSLVLSLVGNDRKEQLGGLNDGFLQMDEVTHLKLNADLVVLSACRTGQGKLIAAEGVMGLTRSFLYAGSRGVVCSLWSVDDAQTARLMETMYSRLEAGDSAAAALRQAKLKLIAEGKAPRYWAPFILVGK